MPGCQRALVHQRGRLLTPNLDSWLALDRWREDQSHDPGRAVLSGESGNVS